MRPNPVAALALVLLPLACIAQTNAGLPKPGDPMPPRSWVDKDTGHRVWRLSDEPNSGAFYFNVNAFTPDLKQMVYNSPDGIRVLDLATMTTRMLVPNTSPPAAPAGTIGLPTVVGTSFVDVRGDTTKDDCNASTPKTSGAPATVQYAVGGFPH